MWDAPYLTCLALYIFSFQIVVTNSRTSTVWKLSVEDGMIVDGTTMQQVSKSTMLLDLHNRYPHSFETVASSPQILSYSWCIYLTILSL